jgi:RNA polymerase-interacting CarD/CdnL/TRCF family regulator
MTPSEVVHNLGRLRDYNSSLSQADRQLLQSAIEVIRTEDNDLTDLAVQIERADALLTMLASPAKYKAQLNDLNSLLKSAREERAAVVAERTALESAHATIGPELRSAKAAHERRLADAQEAFDKRVADYQKQLAVRSDALRVLEERTRADTAENARLKEELQKKLDAIRTMAA